MQNYKDLNVWFKSHEITLEIYSQTKGFPKEEINSFNFWQKISITYQLMIIAFRKKL
jgi:hypothetical protein